MTDADASGPATGTTWSPPQLGVFFDLRNPPQWRRDWGGHYQQTLELAEEAERLGAGSAWVSEHHFFDDGYMPQPITFLAALAARTHSMRLGTAILLAALRHPRHIAEEAAVVDILSGGRLELGIGAGYIPAEYEAFGVGMDQRRDLTDDTVIAVQQLLRGGELLPPPVQSAVPMWLGYQGPKGARRAGRLGVGLLATDPTLVAPYRDGLVEGGHDPSAARMGGVINLVVSNDPERAAPRLAPHVHHQQSTYAMSRRSEPPFSADGVADLEAVTAQLLDRHRPDNRMVVADVDTAVDILQERTSGIPAQHVYLWASVAGMPDDLVDEHVRLAFGPVRRAWTQRLATAAGRSGAASTAPAASGAAVRGAS